jgi:hypothetical protein
VLLLGDAELSEKASEDRGEEEGVGAEEQLGRQQEEEEDDQVSYSFVKEMVTFCKWILSSVTDVTILGCIDKSSAVTC